MRFFIALSLLFGFAFGSPRASASPRPPAPQPPVLLRDPDRLLAQSSWTAVTLYDLQGQSIRTFDLGQWIDGLTVSRDGQHLLLTGTNHFRVFDIDGAAPSVGLPRAEQHPRKTVSFFVGGGLVCVAEGTAVVIVRVADGSVVQRVETNRPVEAVVVTPDGKTVLADAGGDLEEITVATGRRRKVASLDGRMLGFAGGLVLMHGKQLRALSVTLGQPVKDFGPVKGSLRRFRTLAGGSARITMYEPGPGEQPPPGGPEEVVYQFDPETRAWAVVSRTAALERTLKATTDGDYKTRLVDVRTGETILTVDNSGNIPGSPFGVLLVLGLVCAAVGVGVPLLIVLIVLLVWRARRSSGLVN